jgi:4-hydroxybenzoate-CoA ligase
MNNIIEVLFERNRSVPDKVAFEDEHGVITYSGLEARSRRMAEWMIRYGVKPGDRVSIVLYDRIDTVAAICATVLIGAVACMVNPRGRRDNMLYQIEYVEPALVIAEPVADIPHSSTINEIVNGSAGLAPWQESSATNIDDVAFILWTSGTTGHGKAVMQSHRNYIETSQLVGVDTIGVDSTDRIYTTAKLFFAIGMYASFFWPMYASAEAYLDSGLSIPARVRKNIERYQPTIFYSVPVIYSQLATRAIDCSALCLAGGDRLPQSVIDRWQEHSGQLIHNTSGVTEGTCCYSYNRMGTTSAGKIVKGYAMRVVDEAGKELVHNQIGRLQIRTDYQALGYYKDPEWTAKVFGHEWMATGDYAYITELGELNYMGRINDVIKINGQFVNPGEIEETLQNYPGVEQAAVISRIGPDDLERIEAYVVPAGTAQLNLQDLRAWMLSQHEKSTCPRVIHTVEELPRTDTGKVQRYILKQKETL